MKHISYVIICDIADGNTIDVNPENLKHVESCKKCQEEIELQKRIKMAVQLSMEDMPVPFLSSKILQAIQGQQKKHWWESIFQNMGNIIAMVFVLSFVLLVFNIVSKSGLQIDTPSNSIAVQESMKFMQNVSHQIITFVSPRTTYVVQKQNDSNVVLYAILAVMILVLFDKVLTSFIQFPHKSKI